MFHCHNKEIDKGAGVDQLDKGIIQTPVPVAFELHIVRKTGQIQILRMEKAFIIGPGHHDINIIIPRDKALVPDSAEQGSAAQGKINIILFAKFCKSVQKLQLQAADLIQCKFFHLINLFIFLRLQKCVGSHLSGRKRGSFQLYLYLCLRLQERTVSLPVWPEMRQLS